MRTYCTPLIRSLCLTLILIQNAAAQGTRESDPVLENRVREIVEKALPSYYFFQGPYFKMRGLGEAEEVEKNRAKRQPAYPDSFLLENNQAKLLELAQALLAATNAQQRHSRGQKLIRAIHTASIAIREGPQPLLPIIWTSGAVKRSGTPTAIKVSPGLNRAHELTLLYTVIIDMDQVGRTCSSALEVLVWTHALMLNKKETITLQEAIRSRVKQWIEAESDVEVNDLTFFNLQVFTDLAAHGMVQSLERFFVSILHGRRFVELGLPMHQNSWDSRDGIQANAVDMGYFFVESMRGEFNSGLLPEHDSADSAVDRATTILEEVAALAREYAATDNRDRFDDFATTVVNKVPLFHNPHEPLWTDMYIPFAELPMIFDLDERFAAVLEATHQCAALASHDTALQTGVDNLTDPPDGLTPEICVEELIVGIDRSSRLGLFEAPIKTEIMFAERDRESGAPSNAPAVKFAFKARSVDESQGLLQVVPTIKINLEKLLPAQTQEETEETMDNKLLITHIHSQLMHFATSLVLYQQTFKIAAEKMEEPADGFVAMDLTKLTNLPKPLFNAVQVQRQHPDAKNLERLFLHTVMVRHSNYTGLPRVEMKTSLTVYPVQWFIWSAENRYRGMLRIRGDYRVAEKRRGWAHRAMQLAWPAEAEGVTADFFRKANDGPTLYEKLAADPNIEELARLLFEVANSED